MVESTIKEVIITILAWLGAMVIGHIIGYHRGVRDERSGKTKNICYGDKDD